MKAPVPAYLESSCQLVIRAYPDGRPDDEEYFGLTKILAPHFNLRGLATVLEGAFGPLRGAYNDAMRANSDEEPSVDALTKAQARLEVAGFDAWIREQENA